MSERQFKEGWEDTDNKVRGPNIPDDWKRYIAEKAIKESYKPRMLLADEILNQMKESRDVKDKLPERESIAKRISSVRNQPKNPFDELWSLGSLAEHPIPPEAMPAVMSVYKKALAEKNELTIREALWIARLFKIIDPPDLVWDWAWAYAMEEWLSKVTSKPFDTTELDSKLISDIYYAQREHSESKRGTAIWGIAEKYNPDFRAPGADFNALFDAVSVDFTALMGLNLSVEETEEIAKSGKYKKEVK